MFDITVIENPFYETSSIRDSLIEQMKNSVLIIDKGPAVIKSLFDVEFRESVIKKAITYGNFPAHKGGNRI